MYQVPRGTRDFTPDEMKKRRYVEENMKKTFISFGYNEIQTPTFENLELFTVKSGDSIIDEIYDFSDKGGRKLALRPELTAPVIRFYVEKLQMEPKPLKLFYFGNCFRYDRPQKGRYREFYQIGCELIGTSTPEAIAELIALAYVAIRDTGLKDINLNIGHVSWLTDQLNIIENNLPSSMSQYYPGGATILRMIDKEDFKGINQAFIDSGATQDHIKNFMDFLNSNNAKSLEKYYPITQNKERERYETIISLLNEFGISKNKINRNMKIARGLDYYNGIVFEIEAPVLGAEKQICGGGEYDLVRLFGGRDTPTVGFAIGFDRTILALETENYPFPTPKTDVYIIPVNEDMTEKSIELAQQLRKEGVITEVDLLRRGVSKSLKHANSKNSEKAIIIGPKELEKDSVTLRDMKTGDQQLVKIAEILSKLKNH